MYAKIKVDDLFSYKTFLSKDTTDYFEESSLQFCAEVQ